jgi:acetyl-CoA carboxylase biotin carboxyl carrier protein
VKKTKAKPQATKPQAAKPAAKGPAKSAPKAASAKAAPVPESPDSKLVRQLAAVLNETGLTEIEYEKGGLRVRVARQGQQVAYAAAPMHMSAAPAAVQAAVAAEAPKAMDAASHPGTVKSPMVGVGYLLPEPGAAPFVSVGATVSEGQTVCLIEAMKTFNPVKAPRSGKVTKILLENGSPVEYGEPLLIIE